MFIAVFLLRFLQRFLKFKAMFTFDAQTQFPSMILTGHKCELAFFQIPMPDETLYIRHGHCARVQGIVSEHSTIWCQRPGTSPRHQV